jgi:hypothetical protein
MATATVILRVYLVASFLCFSARAHRSPGLVLDKLEERLHGRVRSQGLDHIEVCGQGLLAGERVNHAVTDFMQGQDRQRLGVGFASLLPTRPRARGRVAGCRGSRARASRHSLQACAEIDAVLRYGTSCFRAPTIIAASTISCRPQLFASSSSAHARAKPISAASESFASFVGSSRVSL